MKKKGFKDSIKYFSSILVEASGGNLSNWSMATYDAAFKWCLYFEAVYQQLSAEEESQVDEYLASPKGHTMHCVLSANDLWCARHKLFRSLLQNTGISAVLLNRVVIDYLKMGMDDDEDDGDASAINTATTKLVDDLVSMTHNAVALQRAKKRPRLNRQPTMALVKDEVEYFQRDESIRMYSCAQLLLKKAKSEVQPRDQRSSKGRAKVFVHKLMFAARKASAMIEVMLLMMLPAPMCLGHAQDREVLVIDEVLRKELCIQLVNNVSWNNLWGRSPYLLVKVATLDEHFGRAYINWLETK